MSVRVQVILEEDDTDRFKAQARKEGKSLSSWLRDAGKEVLETKQTRKRLKDPAALKAFFKKSNATERGAEPDWQEHKNLILESYHSGHHR